jgi:NADH:ubiquinone oxidoreductase subunit K
MSYAKMGRIPTASGTPQAYTITMTLFMILLGLVGWAIGLGIVLVLFRMSSDQDRAARHAEKRLDPFSNVEITQNGAGRY